ncbi:hypothetical protein TrLO_g9810 [Triparma laevis f. longispina]|uniref:Chlorophyll a-b binding protein, chloroplastic n=1 Tax=Triparma laevis f. longispina TaxID=1714387 RepID=A0A9W7FS22_9STRA|nr:hypothetical protein TrLO_g9810 [Triparma laevis f. longispina]
MQFTIAVLSTLLATASGFAFSPAAKASTSALKASEFSDPGFCAGLPGALAPVGQFDPLNFLDGADDNKIRRFREAELTHGRVAMLAFVGFLVGEKVEGSSFLFDSQITGPAINHFAQVPQPFWEILVLTIGASEVYRAQVGWVSPADLQGEDKFALRPEYIPGDIGFDPLNLRPEDPEELEIMQTKELQHGRLAMLATAGFVAQELTDGQGIMQHLGM